jgi:pseudouridylate synthase / pseudouridine kinase
MPYPKNIETARSVERIVRSTGAVPATIGLIGGRIKIGLEQPELERLADTMSNPSVVKLSRRDIAPAIAMKKDAGTTCSATLIFAALAGIRVRNDPIYDVILFSYTAGGFCNGRVGSLFYSWLLGIFIPHFSLGGVHRGGERCKSSFHLGKIPFIVSWQEALDISADLHELSRCPVGLVSAGVKSILDIGKFVVGPALPLPLT